MEKKKARVIKFNQLVSNGPVYEKQRTFEESFFRDAYHTAENLVLDIVENNEKYMSAKMKSQDVRFEASNVISFIGRRGTGKTSCMLSFAQALSEASGVIRYSGNKNMFNENDMMKSVVFHKLESIDAAVMEEGEDVFAIILANMFDHLLSMDKKSSRKTEEYDNRQLFEKFENIYEDFITLNSDIKQVDEYSTFEKLKNIANSRKIRENFAELVEQYLDIVDQDTVFGKEYKRCREPYLVIVIDDLDMAKQRKENEKWNWGAYKIMNTIYKYLMVPRVIILTAYNHNNLFDRCMDFYRLQYADRFESEPQYCQHTTSQLIEKTFPIHARVYMPSWKKRDLTEGDYIQIDITNNEAGILERFREAKIERLSVKQFVFAIFEEKAEIYFDPLGKKKHFLEPDALRSLYNDAELLTSLRKDDFGYNIKRLKQDCFFRFKEEKLGRPDERKLFDEWLEEPIERRNKKIVETLSKKIYKLGKRIREEEKEVIQNAQKTGIDITSLNPATAEKLSNRGVAYSYAELVHSIYHMTRSDLDYSKNIVACILYSNTLYLTEIYKRYQEDINSNEDKREELYNNALGFNEKDWVEYTVLKEVIGESVCGGWNEYYFPEIRLKSKTEYPYVPEKGPYNIGYVERGAHIITIHPNQEGVFSHDQLKALLFVAMLYTDALNWTKNNVLWEREKDSWSLSLCPGEGAKFDLTGFLKHTFCYSEFLGRMKTIILTSLERLEEDDVTSDGGSSNSVKNKIIEVIEESFKEILKDYYEWEKVCGNMMLPLYSVDITYNLIKRVFQDCKKEKMGPINIIPNDDNNEFWQAYLVMLDRFKVYLLQIDKKYNLAGFKSFAQAFTQCPFYKFVLECQSEKEERKIITDYIALLIQEVFIDEDIIKEDPET